MKSIITLLALAASSTLTMAADMQLTDAVVDTAFAKVDTDRDGTVSLAEAKKFGISSKLFHKANLDKDGTLDKKEFSSALQAKHANANADNDGTLAWPEAKKAGVRSKKVFEAADSDNDGTLDIAEYLAALTSQAK